ncbi:hypothetical protein J32TS6_17040 [Virgibacillus pantothenticus]|uniref:hypothetical protein n=1 Tax=Virgibacillus pantothenticus TaxID=1473 RepID=UPI001B01D1D3|nr:hypothetical protein [Virgibacillus pantothenticus]GIP63149.1 hypothetical protein J32TS6_17040 [Virgibacillus pantothenticus]
MFNLMKVESMYINSIRDLVINLSENESKYIVINKFVKPLYKVENYYNESISQENFSLNLLYSRDTSADLALEVTNKFPKKRYHYFLYAQNQPDYKSLNSPLAFILEKSNFEFDEFIGITHLDNVSSIESLKLMEFNFQYDSFILIVEKVLNNIVSPYGMKLGSAAVGIELNKNQGLKVKNIMSYTTTVDGTSSVNVFLDELIDGYKRFSDESSPSHKVIVQNSLKGYIESLRQSKMFINNIYFRKGYNNMDFQSADVWITLKELLNKYQSLPQDVILISTNFHHKVCFCSIRI